ncbi:hypothetical protein Q5P01_001203 [Channa striata]|uniref:CCDC66 domain-containing protein n=1 Tax=Channa striata TaxID=64152 RepID=A0AA88NLX4_CHASR|nr:hypothetical protein Q5P01_001203 [Channa striata]
MNLGDKLLFELENGKPKLILLSHGVDKIPKKQLSFRPRVANILSTRQPSFVEEVQEERPIRQQGGRHRDPRSRAGVTTPFTSNTIPTVGKSTTLTLSKTHEHNKGGNVKTGAKVKSERQKHSTNVGALRANGKTGQPQRSVTQGSGKDLLASGGSMVCLTNKQLQQILNTVQTLNNGQHPLEDHRTQDAGDHGNQTNLKCGAYMTERGGEMKQEDSRGRKELKNKGGGEGVSDAITSPPDNANRLSGCMFSWLEEQQSDSRATLNAKKAQWRRELDEQVALKQQQRSDPGRLQAEEDRESVLSVRSSISCREQPAAIKSSLKFGEVTPVEEVLSVERREEQRRRWLEELDRQREETIERRRREKLLESQMEDHDLWATHFDSLRRRPPVQSAAPPAAPSTGSEHGEWEPLSRLSLVSEATSSCRAESACTVSVDTTNGGVHQSKARYLRTMTALLDPAQIDERQRRRLKQLEQQRAIEAQMEEHRRQREQEEARRREEDAKEERRLKLEREMLQRQYELESMRERQKEEDQPKEDPTNDARNEKRLQETVDSSAVTRKEETLQDVVTSLVLPFKDSAVQTEATPSVPLRAEKVQAPPPQSAAPPNSRSRALRTGKENMGGDPYEAFARTERNQRDKRKPEWNTQRPSRRFVPASERYPATLQRNRQESRLKRQAELLAQQERACWSRNEPPPQSQEPRLCSNPAQLRSSPGRKVESVLGGQSVSAATNAERGRSPPIPTLRHRVQSRHASPPSPPGLEFVPYVRTDEVFNLDPLEPADTPPPDTHTVSPPAASRQDPLPHPHPERLCYTHTHRQQEILRGLAQLRQTLTKCLGKNTVLVLVRDPRKKNV